MQFEISNRGGAVLQLQKALAGVGYDPGPLDGIFGRLTHGASVTFANHHMDWHGYGYTSTGIAANLAGAILDAHREEVRGLDVFGVWITSNNWRRNPDRYAGQLAALGVRDAYLVLNDNSHRGNSPNWHIIGDGATEYRNKVRITKRRATPAGRLRARDKVLRAVEAYHAAGLRVRLMSWIRPDAQFLDEAAEDLLPILEGTGGRVLSVMWDAEETWIHGDALPHEDAAARWEGLFAGTGFHSVTPIAARVKSDEVEALTMQPTIRAVCVQAYATNTSKARPGLVQDYARRLWKRSRAAAAGKTFFLGLPLYRQAGAGGLTAPASLAKQFGTARAYPDCRGLVAWASWDVLGRKRNSTAAKFLRSFAEEVSTP